MTNENASSPAPPQSTETDLPALQARVRELQLRAAKGEELTQDEIREAITAIRILRRTNTGPAASAKSRSKRVKQPTVDIMDILNQSVSGGKAVS